MNVLGAFLIAFSLSNGFTIASRKEGDMFNWFRKLIDRLNRRGILSKYLANPIILCSTCMAVLWGGLCFLFLVPFSFLGIWKIIPFILGLAVANELFWWVISALESIVKAMAELTEVLKAIKPELENADIGPTPE